MRTGLWIVLGCAMMVGSVGCSSGQSNEAAAQAPVEALSPEQLFQRKCASCHGATGQGNGPLSSAFPNVADLSSSEVQSRHTDEGIAGVITGGLRRMPPVRGLSASEVSSLVEHVRTLAAP